MTDKHSHENYSLNPSANPCCYIFDKYFSGITAFQLKRAFLFSNIMLKWLSQFYLRCVKLFIYKISCSYQLHRQKYSRLFIVEFCIYHF